MRTGIYKHYKGKLYQVIGLAHHSETLEELVVYKSLYSNENYPEGTIWVRPRKMFEEHIKAEGKITPRFLFIE